MPRGFSMRAGQETDRSKVNHSRSRVMSYLHSSGPHGMLEKPGEMFSDRRTRTEEALD